MRKIKGGAIHDPHVKRIEDDEKQGQNESFCQGMAHWVYAKAKKVQYIVNQKRETHPKYRILRNQRDRL